MPKPPSDNIRLTITVTPEVHRTFQRLAEAGSMSLSRAMGDWLADTVEAAEFTAQKMEQARAAPKIVMREMHAYAMGLADETGALMDQLREKGRADRASASAARRPTAALTPPSNTGVTNVKNTAQKGGTHGKDPR